MQHAREVNEAIAHMGRTFEVEDAGLAFFCECEAAECVERVSLPLGEYEGLRADSEPVLVHGHPLVRAAQARAQAEDLRESAAALRAQSAQQIERAKRNEAHGRDDEGLFIGRRNLNAAPRRDVYPAEDR